MALDGVGAVEMADDDALAPDDSCGS